jgi:hypothetical protein
MNNARARFGACDPIGDDRLDAVRNRWLQRPAIQGHFNPDRAHLTGYMGGVMPSLP